MKTAARGRSHPLEDVAKVTFTSGSTGTPRGVCLSRGHIENTLQALDRVVTPGTSCHHLLVLPLVTLLENIAGLYLSLLQGAEILLYPMAEIGFTKLASLDDKIFFSLLNQARPQSLMHVGRSLMANLVLRPQARLLVTGSTFGSIGFPGFSNYYASDEGTAQKYRHQLYRLACRFRR
jgi:acyl-CoA synthetase (AMP-forming)/AMP-acid ligase II